MNCSFSHTITNHSFQKELIFQSNIYYPYLIKLKRINLPGVPDIALPAPGNVNTPFSLRKFTANWAVIVDDQTLCFHIKSLFLIKSKFNLKN